MISDKKVFENDKNVSRKRKHRSDSPITAEQYKIINKMEAIFSKKNPASPVSISHPEIPDSPQPNLINDSDPISTVQQQSNADCEQLYQPEMDHEIERIFTPTNRKILFYNKLKLTMIQDFNRLTIWHL